ncbi:MAG: OmpH family outer membrane protein [Sphingobacteriales bacterium]|jgi:outer membrane protein
MKNFQNIAIVILAILVTILFYVQFSGTSSKSVSSAKSVSGNEAKELKIAYVDIDSIQANYEFYKAKSAEFEKKKENADRQLNGSFQKIEGERAAFAQRGNSITQAEYESFQRDYTTKMQNLENQKRVMEGQIQEEGFKMMEDFRKRINDFLIEYNKKKGYTYIYTDGGGINFLFYKDSTQNITKEVVDGLNAAYRKAGSK